MEIVYLSENKRLPDPVSSDKSGLLAVGGLLTAERLLEAYSKGIFPWYSEGEPVLWWSPDPRLVLFPRRLHVSKQMRRLLKRDVFQVTVNNDFSKVMEMCGAVRRNGEGTWITGEMKSAYLELHHMGYAHSVEVWRRNELAGGLYGISFGKLFFGESMFTAVSNSSKFGFIRFTQYLESTGFRLIDCQVETPHLKSLGAVPIDRGQFLGVLAEELKRSGMEKNVFPDSL